MERVRAASVSLRVLHFTTTTTTNFSFVIVVPVEFVNSFEVDVDVEIAGIHVTCAPPVNTGVRSASDRVTSFPVALLCRRS
jgi:hypothetical protein